MPSGVSECSCWPLKELPLFSQPRCAAFIFNQRFGGEQNTFSLSALGESTPSAAVEAPVLALCQRLFQASASFFQVESRHFNLPRC